MIVPMIACAQVVLEGEIRQDMTLTNDNTYLLRGAVFVGNDTAETVLTIEPGTIIMGSTERLSFLSIRRGSKIMAEGTAEMPIVFTSDKRLADRRRSDWGGLILSGRAPINKAGGEADHEGGAGRYGGGENPDSHDNSGVLKYVRVEYGGRQITPDNELNGIAFGGVGDGTTVDYVHVHMGSDDGVEFFGGTVNVKHIFITGAADDCFDWTDGWTGKAQFVVAQQYGDEANNGFECDNSAIDNDASPRSAPMIYNWTFIGDKGDSTHHSDIGMLVRQGTAGKWMNGIMVNFGDCGIDIDQERTFVNGWDAGNNRLNGNLMVDNCIFFDNRDVAQLGETGGNDEAQYPFTSARFINELNSHNNFSNPMLGNPYTRNRPDFRPGANSPAMQNVANPPDDGFFDRVDFRGGVDPDNDWLVGWTTSGSYRGRDQIVLEGEITEDMTLTRDYNYLLNGAVFIGNDTSETVLTIEPGTMIMGSTERLSFLSIRRGSKIMAEGTAEMPIVFTSDRLSAERRRSDWGGVILSGRAPINKAGGEADHEGDAGRYGGGNNPNPHDNSGVLRYVRVEFGGRQITPDNELNGIAFGGVGDGTTVDYIHVHMGSDDGVEFFGGTVNVKHVYITGAADDCFDWTDGWTGKAQFVVAQQYGDEANNGFECDNSAIDNDASPRSNPSIWNWTFIGDKGDSTHHSDIGMLVRQGTAGKWMNGIMMNFGDCGIDIDQERTFTNAWDAGNNRLNGNLMVDNCIFFDNHDVAQLGETGGNAEAQYPFTSERFINQLNANNRFNDPMLGDAYTHDDPSYQPEANSPAMQGFAEVPNDGWYEAVNFVGGVGPRYDWLEGWTVPGTHNPNEVIEAGDIYIPDTHRLISAYPNPFNSTTRINYVMAAAGKASLKVYSLDGRVVATLVEGSQTRGSYSTVWNAEGISNGTYIVRLETSGYTTSRIISLVK